MKKTPVNYFILLISLFIFFLISGCQSEPKNITIKKIPRSKRAGLVVLNFKNSTLEDNAHKFKPWEFGIASMIMTDLESVGLFNIVSMERLSDILDQQALQQLGVINDQDAIEIGKIAAAKYLLTGSFMELNGYLRLEAQVFSIERGIQLGAAEITDQTSAFFRMEKKLVLNLLDHMDVVLNKDEQDLISKNIETKSIDASLNNYAGELAMFQANALKKEGKSSEADPLIEEAKNRFEEALQNDPKYARAKKNLINLAKAIPMTI